MPYLHCLSLVPVPLSPGRCYVGVVRLHSHNCGVRFSFMVLQGVVLLRSISLSFVLARIVDQAPLLHCLLNVGYTQVFCICPTCIA